MPNTFPTLNSGSYDLNSWGEKIGIDPTIRSPKEAGYVQTRAKFTRLTETFHVKIVGLDETDRDTLWDFERSMGVGSDIFAWTHPSRSVSYDTRFGSPISYVPMGTDNTWSAEFDLEQV